MQQTSTGPRNRPRRHSPGRRARRARRLVVAGLIGSVTLAPVLPDRAEPAAAAGLEFPFLTEFDTADGGTLSGTADVLGGRLRLTEAKGNQAGSWSTDGTFASSLGLQVDFRYSMYGGDGADGLLLYLADGAAQQGVGQYGAALGYGCRKRGQLGDGVCDLPGVPGGFVGIALDRHGNYSIPLNESGPGRSPDSVALRGSGDGTDGYRFLRNAPAPDGLEVAATTTRGVGVTIQPDADGVLGITVTMDDAAGRVRTVLDDVPLFGPGQAPLPKTLRLGFAASTGQQTNVHEVDRLRVALPGNLRVEHDVPDTVSPGERVSYTVTATNLGRNDSDPSPFTLAVPDGLTDVTWTCTATGGGSCADASGSGSVDTALGLPRDATAVFTVTGTVAADGGETLHSRATIDLAPVLGDTDTTDNESRARIRVVADADDSAAEIATEKSVALVDGATELHPGDDVEYTVTARNRGDAPASAVGARDELHDRLAFASSDDGCSADGQLVTCNSDVTLAPGESHAFRFRATLDPEYRGDGSDVPNVAVATSPDDADGGDPSDPVVLPPVRDGDDGPGDGGGDDGGGDDGAGDGGSGGADDGGAGDTGADGGRAPGTTSGGRGGALAYTGSAGIGALAVVGATLALTGVIVRRRIVARSGAHAPTDAGSAPVE